MPRSSPRKETAVRQGPQPGHARPSGVFDVPEPPSLHVRRSRLAAELDRAEDLPLVVVSAPAGTGKTTVVAEWARSRPVGAICWVDFDDGQAFFWGLVLKSLRAQGLDVPTSWTPPAAGVLGVRRLEALVELLLSATSRWTVVIDGYELASVELAREVDHLLHRARGRLRFVFVGRVDPVLPLYRYRLTDSVLEIRAPDLAFSDEEADRLLRAAGTDLAYVPLHDLNERLRGWAAGLRFAARALAGRDDAERYAAMVVEQTSDINEYLVREVLDVQPPEVRRLLLDTSVTDVFSADLARMIGGSVAVHTMADLVGRMGFVEPVPGRPGYFRHYPFFKSLLLAQLSFESPERLVELRKIASSWYRHQGLHAKSLAQLAKIGAWHGVATQLVADGWVGSLLLEDPGGVLGDIAGRLPGEIDGASVHAVRAATALKLGEAGKERCERELALARQAVRGQDPDPCLVVSLAVTDALRACLTDDAAHAAALVSEAERLLSGMPAAPQAPALQAAALYARGVTALRLGDLPAAGVALDRACSLAPLGTTEAFRADCLGHRAMTDALHGELAAAVRHGEESLTVAGRAGFRHDDARPSGHVALAWVGVERCDASLVREHVTAASSCRTLPADPFCTSLAEGAASWLEQSGGQVRQAFARLEATAAVSASRDPWVADHLRVEAARLSTWKGEPERALGVLEEVQLAGRPEVVVALGAALAEQGTKPGDEAATVPDDPGVLDTQVRMLLVDASLAAHQSAPGRARTALSSALRLAARERMRRPFREAGASVRRLLAAEPRLVQQHRWLQQGVQARADHPPTRQPGEWIVVEPLTLKELEVLGHLAELLTTDEIAEKMFVSVNTVRTHIRNLLHKLGVSRRNAAVRRARELGLLDDWTTGQRRSSTGGEVA